MGEFKDRLWRELEHAHGDDLARIDRRADVRRVRRFGPRLLAGASLALAALAAAIAVALGLGAASTSPAFAVSRNSDGSVTVSITRPDAIAAANARLAALGIRARAVPVVRSCIAAPVALRLARSPLIVAYSPQSRGRLVRPTKVTEVRFYPGRIPLRAMLILDAYIVHGELRVSARRWMRGNVPPCLPRNFLLPAVPVGPLRNPLCPVPLPVSGAANPARRAAIAWCAATWRVDRPAAAAARRAAKGSG
jgi:hypothetical protein